MIYAMILICGLVWWHGYTLGRDFGARRQNEVASRAWLAGRRSGRDDERKEPRL